MATTAVETTNIKVDVQGVNFGQRAASASLKFPLAKKRPDSDVGKIWKKYRNRRLIGRLMFGPDDPEQTFINGTERLAISGSFDTHKPSFDDETATLKITFDENEIDEAELLKFKYSEAWLCIDEIVDIPPPEKGKKKANTTSEPLGLIGLDGPMTEKMTNVGVQNVGHLVDLVNGDFPMHTIESMKIKGRLPKLLEKIELYFEGKGIESPLGE